jgi:F-type H+-transporting ATPase subunit delta
MSIALSSKRYAQAIFQIAKANNDYDTWQKNLNRIAELMQNPEFAEVIDNPKFRFDQKEKIIRKLLEGVDPLAINLALVLVLKNRFRYTEQIAKEYTAIYDESRGIKRASFTTAVSLNETDKKNYTAQLEKIIGNKLHIDFEVDNNIIGGFIARIDGSLIDGSLRNRLDILRDQISKYGK